MEPLSLTELANELLDAARTASAGRSARTIAGGSDRMLRHSVLALTAGRSLGEHESPGEATLQVLAGRVRLIAGEESVEAGPGDFLPIPPVRHDLAAIDDSVVMLTVVKQAHA